MLPTTRPASNSFLPAGVRDSAVNCQPGVEPPLCHMMPTRCCPLMGMASATVTTCCHGGLDVSSLTANTRKGLWTRTSWYLRSNVRPWYRTVTLPSVGCTLLILAGPRHPGVSLFVGSNQMSTSWPGASACNSPAGLALARSACRRRMRAVASTMD